MSTAQFTLMSEAASNPAAIPFFDALSAAARAKLGVGPDWQWYAAEVLRPTDDTLVTGGVPNAGRRGRGRWKGVEAQKCVVTRAEMAAACAEYERTSGNCFQCAGAGRRVTGWSSNDGHSLASCARCAGKGTAPAAGGGA